MSNKKRSMVYFAVLLGLIVSFAIVGAATATQSPYPPESVEGTYVGTSTAVKFDISSPLRDIPAKVLDPFFEFVDGDKPSLLDGPLGPQDIDSIVQDAVGPNALPTPIVSFDAFDNQLTYTPPDPVGDVGPNHYIAMSNVHFAVFDKSGNTLYGPVPNNTLWSGFGGDCETNNSGDPIVVYDQLADRWMLTQFTSSGPIYYNCVALSVTGDPLGSYYRWAFAAPSFPDYPKYGVWPDAYYISTREDPNIGAFALNRTQMLAGNPTPQVISFHVSISYNTGYGLLPADLDGTTLPPAGSPEYYMGTMDNGGTLGAPQDAMTLWEFDVDWAVPGNSSFTLVSTLPTSPYDAMFPCSPTSRDCIPQPGTSEKLDILSYRQRPLWRLAYRNFGTHESLVTNQAVEAGPAMAGIRWWEVRNPSTSPVIYQEGTYAPGVTDGIHRWMGSIAMDQSGNMALGYSASDGISTYPSVWYTGRLATDPLGTMPQGEGSIVDGGGSQLSSGSRWGDYTSMNVDPVDDCTFWYVNEYYPSTSTSEWYLRVGAFKFDECGEGLGTLTGQVTDDVSGEPIEGVDITVPGILATTNASGVYTMTLMNGTYDVTADHTDYFSETVTGVDIFTDTVTVLDFALSFDQQAGLDLSPANSSETGMPGEMVTHTFTVENTGNYTDSYTLSLSGNDWDTDFPANTGDLGAGETLALDVTVSIPVDPMGRAVIASDAFTLTATSDYDIAVNATVNGTTNANVEPGIEISPESQSINSVAGEVITYTFAISNTGDYPDTFALSASGTWTATLSTASTGELGVGEGVEVTLVVEIPADALIGESDIATLTATSGLDGDITATATAESRIMEFLLYLTVIMR
jgi:hypothetical protein